MNRKTIKNAAVLLLGIFFVLSMTTLALAADKSGCAKKAQETIDNLDKWISKYNTQMEGSEPVQKGKFEEWIRELNKLKSLVQKAQDKLESGEGGCTSDDCVEDQCSMIDIAEQQVTQLIEETEEELGKDSISGDTAGREVTVDDDQMGTEDILDLPDPDDATQQSYANDSATSDQQSGGLIGDVFENSGNPDQDGGGEVTSEDPLEEVSPQ